MEPDRNDEWISVDLKDLHKYNLTKSFQDNIEKIIEMINNKIKINNRKRKKPNKPVNGNSENEITESNKTSQIASPKIE
jgi:hypothetical protein